MKKFLATLFLGLLWCNVGFAKNVIFCKLISQSVGEAPAYIETGISCDGYKYKEISMEKYVDTYLKWYQSFSKSEDEYINLTKIIKGKFVKYNLDTTYLDKKIAKKEPKKEAAEEEKRKAEEEKRKAEEEIYKWIGYGIAGIVLIIFIIYIRNKDYVFKRSKTKLSKAKKRKLATEPSSSDLGARLKKLRQMYKDGILSKVEFEKAKNKLLK